MVLKEFMGEVEFGARNLEGEVLLEFQKMPRSSETCWRRGTRRETFSK